MLQVASIFMENNFGSDFLRFPEEILITLLIFIIICLLAFLFECYERCIKKRMMINEINQNINQYNRQADVVIISTLIVPDSSSYNSSSPVDAIGPADNPPTYQEAIASTNYK